MPVEVRIRKETFEEVAAEIDQAVTKALAEASGFPTTSEDGIVVNGFRVRRTKDGKHIVLEGV